jgi:hypothetical protein
MEQEPSRSAPAPNLVPATTATTSTAGNVAATTGRDGRRVVKRSNLSRSEWVTGYDVEYGLKVTNRDPTGKVTVALCRFCAAIGRERTPASDEADGAAAADNVATSSASNPSGRAASPSRDASEPPPKRQRRRRGKRTTMHHFKSFRSDAIVAHLAREHPKNWAAYQKLSAAGKSVYFDRGEHTVEELLGRINDATFDVDARAPSVVGDNPPLVGRVAGGLGGPGAVEVDATSGRSVIAALKEAGIGRALVMDMEEEGLASTLAAFLISYNERRADKFVELRRCLTRLFLENDVTGDTLVGDNPVLEGEFFDAVVDGLNEDDMCKATMGYKSRLGLFLRLLRALPD